MIGLAIGSPPTRRMDNTGGPTASTGFRSDPDRLPRPPDREGHAAACLDVDEERVAVGGERRPGELVAESRHSRRAHQSVERDVPQLAAAGETADVVVDGAVLADDQGARRAGGDVVGEVEAEVG